MKTCIWHFKFIIVYLYAVFILNVISIFYMDRANNSLDEPMEFWFTLILAVLIASYLNNDSKITPKQLIAWVAGLLIGAPIVFFAHIVFNL